jgi:hypothetical protein
MKRLGDNPIDDDFKEFNYFNLIASLIGCRLTDIINLQQEDFLVLQEHFDWLSDFEYNKTTTLMIDGIEYTAASDLNSLSAGEIISIETIIKGNENKIDSFDMILSILLRPCVRSKNEFGEDIIKVKDLDSFVEIKERAKIFREKALIVDVYNVINLFFSGGKKSTNNTRTSSGLKIVRKNQN